MKVNNLNLVIFFLVLINFFVISYFATANKLKIGLTISFVITIILILLVVYYLKHKG